MADDLDQASALAASERDAGIARARAAAQRPGPPHNGFCYACGEDVASPRIFCGSTCAAEHQRRKRRT